MVYLYLIGSWLIYFAIHSALASNVVKKQFPSRFYRIIYNLIAILGLLGIFTFTAFQPIHYLFPKSGLAQIIGLMLATYGILILKKAFKQYSIKQFLGIEVVETSEKSLNTSGILQYVRHPIYTATILLVSGFFFFAPTALNLVSALCIFAYFIIGIQLEERKLIDEFGDDYRQYQAEVPMLFPKGMKWGNLLK
ncbi:MAG: methyltransferase family protein [Flammeovirgaceae bacterium]